MSATNGRAGAGPAAARDPRGPGLIGREVPVRVVRGGQVLTVTVRPTELAAG